MKTEFLANSTNVIADSPDFDDVEKLQRPSSPTLTVSLQTLHERLLRQQRELARLKDLDAKALITIKSLEDAMLREPDNKVNSDMYRKLKNDRLKVSNVAQF